MPDLDLLHISLADQCLYGFARDQLRVRLPVSTATSVEPRRGRSTKAGRFHPTAW